MLAFIIVTNHIVKVSTTRTFHRSFLFEEVAVGIIF